MKFASMRCATGAALGLLLAACGGGGGGTATTTPPPAATSVQISGTAAAGAALANAAVDVKCATGTGSATTGADGRYTLNIQGAVLPCMVRVRGMAGGTAVVLHSFTETATTDAATAIAAAVANVSPLTEMVAAQLATVAPSIWFDQFRVPTSDMVTTARLQAATAAVLAALKAGAGIDFGAIDPFKSALVAASGSTAGNGHDQLLDRLGAQLSPAALPQLINSILNAGGSAGLQDAMLAVAGGNLAGCPQALSGKYRTIDYGGRAVLRDIDFKKATFSASDGGVFTISPVADTPCAFTVTGTTQDDRQSRFDVVVGPGGVGAYRTYYTAPVQTPGTIGYLVPAQAHALASASGSWHLLQTGYRPGPGTGHYPSGITIHSDTGAASTCVVALSNWSCHTDGQVPLALAARGDGGFDLKNGSQVVGQAYAYRAPGGSTTLFGTNNAAGATSLDVEQTSFVGVQLEALALPAVGDLSRYWYTEYLKADDGSYLATSPTADSSAVSARDVAAATVTRTRVSDGRLDRIHYNSPIAGVRERKFNPPSELLIAMTQVALPGLGLTVNFNTDSSTVVPHFYGIVVARP